MPRLCSQRQMPYGTYMINADIPPLLKDVADRLYRAYGTAPSSLYQQSSAIGRDMPRKYRNALHVLITAEQAMAQPKVALQFDTDSVKRA